VFRGTSVAGTYLTAGDVIIQYIGQMNGGPRQAQGQEIALVYHDSPYAGADPAA